MKRMKRLPALVLVGIAVAAATGASAPSSPRSGQPFRVTLYFLTDEQSAPLGVRRTVFRRGAAPVARPALQALLAGPDERARQEGLTTAIPRGTRIRSLSIARRPHGSTAIVDLSGLPPLSKVNGATIARIGTQISRTLIGLSDIARVRIEANGRPWNFWLMSGGISTRPWDYELLVGLWVGRFKALP
jgi:spore germination protein GerM